MVDSYRHKGLRKQLVDVIRERGITCEKVLAAIGKIPRHLFLDQAFLEFAYQDKAFPIGAGQTISHPFTVAFQTELLEIKPREKVLEIGTGSGYQACVLIEMGARVYSIERQKALFDKTKGFLRKIGYRVNTFYGDGYKGLPTYAPFDKIIITAGAPFVPEQLKEQLKVGGRMVIPVGEGKEQQMLLLIKKSETEFEQHNLGVFSFVPMLIDKASD